MSGVLFNTLLVSLTGGVIGLDRNAAFQTMVSRPLVTAPVIGYLLGSITTGLVAGVLIELLLMGDLPVGAYVPLHETSLAAAVSGISVGFLDALPGQVNTEFFWAFLLVPVVILIMVPVSLIYKWADNLTRSFNSKFFHSASEALSAGKSVSLVGMNLKGLLPVFVSGFGTLFVTVLPLMYAAKVLAGSIETLPALLLPAAAACALIGIGAGVKAVGEGSLAFVLFSVAGLVTAFIMVIAT